MPTNKVVKQIKSEKKKASKRLKLVPCKQFKIQQQQDKSTIYTFTTDKYHSEFICPWDREFVSEAPVRVLSKLATEQIKLTDRIQLDFCQQPSVDELVAILDRESEAMSKLRGEGYINEEKEEERKDDQQPSKTKIKNSRGIKMKLAAIKLHKSGMRATCISKALHLARTTIYRWLEHYKKGNQFLERKKRKDWRECKPYKHQMLKQEFLDDIRRYFEGPQGACTTVMKIKKYLITLHPEELKNIGKSTLRQWVRKAGYTYKRLISGVAQKNSLDMIRLRYTAASILCQNVHKNREVIFLDEVGFNQDLMPFFGYSEVGKSAYAVKRATGDNYTAIAAMTKTRFMGYQVFRGAASTFDFGFFFISLLKTYPDIVERRNDYTFFLDNARLHKSEAIKDFMKQLNICYSAPYSPILNPIELLFSTWKRNFRQQICHCNDSIMHVICASSKTITAEKLAGYYSHSLKYHRLSLLEQNID